MVTEQPGHSLLPRGLRGNGLQDCQHICIAASLSQHISNAVSLSLSLLSPSFLYYYFFFFIVLLLPVWVKATHLTLGALPSPYTCSIDLQQEVSYSCNDQICLSPDPSARTPSQKVLDGPACSRYNDKNPIFLCALRGSATTRIQSSSLP